MNFNEEEAFKATLSYFGGDELAADAFLKKYALRDKSGRLQEITPADMHHRLAREFARIESKYPNPLNEHDIYVLFDRFKYIVPQGSPMSGIGNTHRLQSLSNCFVIESPYDSYTGIMLSDQQLVQIMKRRGGVGLDISTLRPRGMMTNNAAITTDGIGVFMQRFSNSCREVAQGGRRGALMITIDVRHPDIETFITIKQDLKSVTGANVSVRVTDEFMQAVESDHDFVLRWPVDSEVPQLTRAVKARDLWDKIVDSAWSSAEPGVLFWDTIKSQTPADAFSKSGFKTISVNPCGEICLSAYDSCRLMVLNVSSYVLNPFKQFAAFDFELFSEHVYKAQRLMDDLIDLELEHIDAIIQKIRSDPEPGSVKAVELQLWHDIKDAAIMGRRTGLGLTGLGDALAYMNIDYASEMGITITENIYKTLAIAANKSSVDMAEERGAFKAYNSVGYDAWSKHPFMSRLLMNSSMDTNEKFRKHGRRNICLTTTAPAGSVSLLTQTTSGLEPVFLLEYTRRRKLAQNDESVVPDYVDELGDRWQEYGVAHHGLKKWMDVTGEKDITLSPYYNSTSSDIDWKLSVDVQAAAQKWLEHSVSKTCNLPASATKNVVSDVYMRAWKTGCKGFTIYRDGSRAGVLIDKKDELDDRLTTFKQYSAPKRPTELTCAIHHVNIKGDAWTILVGLMDGKPYEVFGGLSKYVEIPKKYDEGVIIKNERKTTNSIYDLKIGNGSGFVIKNIVEQFDNPNYSDMTRLISLTLRHGTDCKFIVEQLQKSEKNADMFSFGRVLARVLKTYIKDGSDTTVMKKCPECSGEKFKYVEGCVSCVNCSWSKCG